MHKIPDCYIKGYPRPQFVRENWFDLCGIWSFAFDDENIGEKKKYYKNFPSSEQKITVPFSYETVKSGIGDTTVHKVVWYSRAVNVPALTDNQRYIIHFEGSDYSTKVWVNGQMVGTHTGGYCRFSVDATDCLVAGENVLTVRCEDSLDTRQPRGKQRWLDNSYGCWYVQTTGLWKPVWSEIVPTTRLSYVKITPDLDTESVRFDYEFVGQDANTEIEANIRIRDNFVTKVRVGANRASLSQTVDLRWDMFVWKIGLWSPWDPNLYDVTFTVYQNGEIVDKVGSYFGLRKIEVDTKGIRLNNAPLYQKLILAQNYWKDSGLTAPDEEALIADIDYTKQAGFNGLRIHQKIEDERFLFWCDVKGLLVWGEFPAQYEYSEDAVIRFTNEWTEAVRQQYNHPSIITWTPFNESWGLPEIAGNKNQQEFTRAIYALTKTYDPYRPVITNDGWEHTCSDILTLHDYDGSGAHMAPKYKGEAMRRILENRFAHGGHKLALAQGEEYRGQPIIMSEYGGIAIEGSQGWGYNGKVKGEEELINKYDDLTSTIKAMLDEGVWGYCYTQLTDVEQEQNGLLDADHKPKVNLDKIRAINDK